MVRRAAIFGSTIAAAAAAAVLLPARAAANDEVDSLWSHYIRMVGCRDATETLACYQEDLRRQLHGDDTMAGRARLDTHMADMFEVLQRDYDHEVVDESDKGKTVIFTVKFTARKKDKRDYTSKVVFVEEDGRWWIKEAPQPPDFLQPRKGVAPMIAGIVLAVGVIAFLAKKFLGG